MPDHFLLGACASTPNTFANADQSVDFSQYKTYGYFSTLSTDKAQYQSLVSNFLMVAVAQELDMRVTQYTEGTLNIDVVDAATKTLVWEGSIAGKLTDNDVRNMEQTVDEAVAAVMDNFPILPGGAP